MVARITAVIAILRGHIVIVGVKPDRAVAHARIQRQFLGKLPGGLQIGVDVPHQVALVTAQVAFLPILRRGAIHDEVFIAFTLFTHVFVVQTGGEGHRHAQFAFVRPARIDALVVAA